MEEGGEKKTEEQGDTEEEIETAAEVTWEEVQRQLPPRPCRMFRGTSVCKAPVMFLRHG